MRTTSRRSRSVPASSTSPSKTCSKTLGGVASYRVLIKPSAVKELEAMPLKARRKLAGKIGALGDEPRPHGAEKLSGQEHYRIRQGEYRAVYSIDDGDRTVLVVKVAHRRNVYRE
ncbi:MAG: type II toxin-antitoxin system RelE family toxin [Gemmatimonadales bacterium]